MVKFSAAWRRTLYICLISERARDQSGEWSGLRCVCVAELICAHGSMQRAAGCLPAAAAASSACLPPWHHTAPGQYSVSQLVLTPIGRPRLPAPRTATSGPRAGEPPPHIPFFPFYQLKLFRKRDEKRIYLLSFFAWDCRSSQFSFTLFLLRDKVLKVLLPSRVHSFWICRRWKLFHSGWSAFCFVARAQVILCILMRFVPSQMWVGWVKKEKFSLFDCFCGYLALLTLFSYVVKKPLTIGDENQWFAATMTFVFAEMCGADFFVLVTPTHDL